MAVKFGVLVPQGWRLDLMNIKDPAQQYDTMSRFGRTAEKLGFDSIWVYDHLETVPTRELEPTLECWISTAALARDTSTVRIGQMVTCNSYRNPALLAKMASTVDALSNGRLNFGIGAGWYKEEYEAYGYPFPDGPMRLKMLEESLQIIRAMWTEPYATFEGKYYQVREAINEPKGVQQPHIPLWVGGSGEKVTLKLVAKYADACNVSAGTDPQAFRHKYDVLRQHCEKLGRDYNTVLKTVHVFCTLLPDDKRDPEKYTEPWRRGRSFEEYTQNTFVGTSEQTAIWLNRLVEVGTEYIVIYFRNNLTNTEILQQFVEEVMPRVK